ncbi:MAG: tetratricopeptide repeat protein [Thermoanaerobaculia bacterium]
MISRSPFASTVATALFSTILLTASAANAAKPAPVPVADGKIPITTSSEAARTAYLEGRDLTERLRVQEARGAYERAVAADPAFALAWLGLANSQPSAKEFFAKLDRAVALADKVTPGERLMILGAKAGGSGDAATQASLYQKLVDMYPDDERALLLLGNSHFGAQRYPEAIELYERARQIAPGFSQIYNQLGYSYRFLGRMDEAEQAFVKYTQVLPDDPNPYDSLAELLLKRGQFDKAIASYRKALAVRPDFVNSNFGIATCLDLEGKGAEARAELDRMLAHAADDGQRRAGLFGKTVSWVFEGNYEAAQAEMRKQLAIAEKAQDVFGMAGDHNAMGNIALGAGDPAAAEAHYNKSLALMEGSSAVAEANKANARRFAHFNLAKAALARGDLARAKKESAALTEAVATSGNPFQKRLAHEIAGRIALAEKRWEAAIAELGKANQLDPYVRWRLAQAWAGKGDPARAKELAEDARNDNSLTNLNFALLRQEKGAV